MHLLGPRTLADLEQTIVEGVVEAIEVSTLILEAD